MGGGFIPKNLDMSLVDETVTVTNEEAFQWSRRLSKEEGIVAGISSGANMCAAAKVAARPEYKGKRICVIMPSLGERYLSTPLFEGLTGVTNRDSAWMPAARVYWPKCTGLLYGELTVRHCLATSAARAIGPCVEISIDFAVPR